MSDCNCPICRERQKTEAIAKLLDEIETRKAANAQLQALVWDLQIKIKAAEHEIERLKMLNQQAGETGSDYVARLLKEARIDE